MTKDIKLPCGCIEEVYDCPKAVKLWNDINRTYEEACQETNAVYFLPWDAYDLAVKTYREHKVIKA